MKTSIRLNVIGVAFFLVFRSQLPCRQIGLSSGQIVADEQTAEDARTDISKQAIKENPPTIRGKDWRRGARHFNDVSGANNHL